MPNKIPNVQVSDTTGDATCAAAGSIIISSFYFLPEKVAYKMALAVLVCLLFL